MSAPLPPHYCSDMKQAIELEDRIIDYYDRLCRYGIVIHDGPHTDSHEGCDSVLEIAYCPFCGAKLPDRLVA